MRSRRKFTKEFKLDAVQRLRAGEPAGLVARSLEVSLRNCTDRWSHDVDKFGERAFSGVEAGLGLRPWNRAIRCSS